MKMAVLFGIFAPILFSLVLALIPKERKELFFPLAIFGSTIPVATALYLYINQQPEPPIDAVRNREQFETIAWIKPYGIDWVLSVNGVSIMMILLTAILVPLAILSSSSTLRETKGFLISILVIESAVVGVFTSGDLLSFFLFFEAILIPMYFLIGIWGGENRKYATIKFILYTVFGSIFLFAGTVMVGLLVGQQFGRLGFDFNTVQMLVLSVQQEKILFLLFTFAFAVKIPIFPFHTWLPDAHVEAPTAGSILLAGVLLKLGTYGIITISIPFFTEGYIAYRNYLAVLGVIGIIYGAIVAIPQKDIKKLVAYSSVSHMGFIVLGIASGTGSAMKGALLHMVNHGITTGALFMLVGFLYDRRHTRDMSELGGVKTVMPLYAATFLITSLASIGLPGLNGFVGEFLILVSSYDPYSLVFTLAPIFAATGVVLAAIYMLGAYERIFTGPIMNEKNESLNDLSLREKLAIGPLVTLMFLFGVYPYVLERAINKWLYRYRYDLGLENIIFSSYFESMSVYIQGLF